MKQTLSKPIPKPQDNRYVQYPVIGTLIGFFSLTSRFKVAQQVLQESAPKRQERIIMAERAISASEQNIQESDALLAESRALRK